MPKYRFDTTNHLNDMCITVQSLLLQTTTSERNLDLFVKTIHAEQRNIKYFCKKFRYQTLNV